SGREIGGPDEPFFSPEDDPDPCGASITPTFTTPGTTSVMMNVPSGWTDAAEYDPSGPTNFTIPDWSRWPLYEMVPLIVTFLTPPEQPVRATRIAKRPRGRRDEAVSMAVVLAWGERWGRDLESRPGSPARPGGVSYQLPSTGKPSFGQSVRTHTVPLTLVET